MGFGKSTFLKKLVEINALENNFVRIFDVSGEFRGEVEEFGGKIIKADGTQTANGIVNMWRSFNPATMIVPVFQGIYQRCRSFTGSYHRKHRKRKSGGFLFDAQTI